MSDTTGTFGGLAPGQVLPAGLSIKAAVGPVCLGFGVVAAGWLVLAIANNAVQRQKRSDRHRSPPGPLWRPERDLHVPAGRRPERGRAVSRAGAAGRHRRRRPRSPGCRLQLRACAAPRVRPADRCRRPAPVPDAPAARVLPLPPRAPEGLRQNNQFPQRIARRATQAPVVATTTKPEDRGFFEKLFGGFGQKPTGQALAYASPEDGAISSAPPAARTTVALPAPSSTAGTLPVEKATAVYDISAHVVILPSGEKLEAHPGLGDRLDDPSRVNERNGGATPPAVYDLTARESLFHGVQAIRLNPVSGNVYGRSGILAHPFMLGPNGDSNGCVSVKDYQRFLQAFQNGEVKRLVVVARQS